MTTLDELKKKIKNGQQNGQQQQETYGTIDSLKGGIETSTNSKLTGSTLDDLKKKIKSNNTNGEINAERALRDSLEDEEKYTVFSTGQIKSRGKQIGNFFDNAWHTITDKDEDKGIKDYSEYKHYKTLLDGANQDIDKTAVYQQMAKEGVIDYDKFIKWQQENKDNKTPFEDYKKAVEDIKESFSLSIEKTLQPYISKVDDSYKLNALTKAAERMNNQFGYFLDGYATTYKDTRDEALLNDLNSIINEYTNNVNKFLGTWAGHLIKDNDSGAGAYYNTLNDAGMRELANGIVKLEWQAEDKMARAAIKSNFGDSWEALKSGNVLSSFAEIVGAALNGADWVLNKVGDVVEETKQAAMGWYDVVEELANLNVYSNDAGALEKAFGTMGSWVGSIVDALPTIGPAAADIIWGSKSGLVKGIRQAGKAYRVAKTTQWAENIDDAINLLFKSKKSYKSIATTKDIVLGAEEGSTFGVKWMKNIMDDIVLFDLSFQQFEGHPFSDDNMALNMLFNLPFDALASRLAQGGRFFKEGLTEADLVTDTISEDMLKRFQKAIKWNKGEGKSVDVMAEEWYMGRSIETSYAPKKTYTKEQIKDLPDGEKLLEYIEKVQNNSKGIWDRLTTFQGVGARDILLETESQLAKAQKNLSLNQKLELGMKKLVDQNKFLNLSAQQISSKQIIAYLQTLVHTGELDAAALKKALEKGVKEDDGFKEIIYSIMTDDVELFNKARLKVENSGAQLSQTELSRRLNSTVGELIQNNPNLVKIKDIVGGYVREGQDTWKNIFKDETITTEVLLSRLRNMDTVDGFSKTENESMLDRIDAMLKNIGKKNEDVSSVFENTQVESIIKNWDPNRWEGVENGVTKQYRKDNNEQVALYSIMKKAGLNIKAQDGKFVIEGNKASLQNLKKSFEMMQGAVNINNLTGGDWVAYKIIFAKQYSQMFNNSVEAINKLNASLGKEALTQKEVLTLADNWTHWTDRLYQEAGGATELEKQVQKKKLKSGIKGDKVNKAINGSLNGNGNAIDVEQEACKEVINNIMLNPKVLEDGNFDRQSLSNEIKSLFKQRLQKNVKPGDGNRGYATIREEEISIIDEETLDVITNKLIDVMDTFKTNSIEDKQDIYSTIANWFSVIAMTPQAANTLKEQGMDFYYTILSGLITKDPKVTTKYMKKMQSFIDETIQGYKSIVENTKGKGKKVAEEYKYNGKVGNLKAGILQLQEGINEVKAYMDNGQLRGMIPGIEGDIKKRLNFLTKNIFNSKDYKDGQKIANELVDNKKFADKFINKTLNTNNLTDDEIDEISKYLARRGMITSNVISKKFYENLYNGYKKGFDVIKQMGNYKIKIDEGANRYSIKGGESVFGILEPAFVLGNIDNANLASSIIVHEITHQQIFNNVRRLATEGVNGKAVEKGIKKAEQETLSNAYFGGSMVSYIEGLRNKLREAVKLSQEKGNENLNSFLYNYTNQYSKREILDGIIEKYGKDNLINELIKDYHNFDRSTPSNYLGSIINNEYITAIEELITEYKTLLAIGEAGYKTVNAPYINKALDILMDAANTIDRYRVLCIEKRKYDDTALRTALSAEYTARDLAGNKSFEDKISDFISREIYSLKKGDVSTNDGIRYIYDIHKAMGTEGIDIATQSPAEIKRILIDNLDTSIRKAKKDDARNSYFRLKKEIEGMNDEEVMSFLDMTDSVYISPYAEYNKIIKQDKKIYEKGAIKEEGNYGTDIKNMSNIDLHRGEKDENVTTLISLLKLNTSNESVPVMNSILTMAGELGGTNSGILTTVAKLIGIEWLPIDANKLLIGENTSRLYDEYIKELNSNQAPMSFATFCTNKVVANVLSTYGLYSEGMVDVINKANRDGILTNAIDNITNSGEGRQATDRVFKAMYNSINEQFGGDIFNYSADEFIKKISKHKLSEFNDKVKQYLYAQLQGNSTEQLEEGVRKAFLNTVTSGEEALTKPLFKEGYAPTVLKGNTGITKREINLAKENAFRQYVNGLEKTNGRFNISRSNGLPQLLNIIQDMVSAKIIIVSKNKARAFGESVLIDLDEKTFTGFMKDYYKLLNDIEGISDKYNQTLLYQHFIYRWTDKLADSISNIPYAKVKTDKYSRLNVYKNTQKDFNGVLDEVSEESYRKYMNENPGLNIDAIYDEEGNYLVDATDDVFQYNDDNQVVNFAFRGDDGATTEKAETLRILQERSDEGFNDIISNDVDSTINNGAFLDKLIEPYKVKYSNEYKILETEGSDLPINVGIYYNKARNADNINAKIANSKEKIGNKLYNKITNFQRGIYDTSSPIKVANNQGVEYMLKSTINGTPVRKVTVQFGNGKKVAYTLKDGELKKIGFNDTIELLDNINSSINGNMGVDVKFISDKGDALNVTHLGKTQIWGSFVGEDIAKEVGIYDDIVRDIDGMAKDEYRKLTGLKITGEEGPVSANDVLNSAKAMPLNKLVNNNDVVLQLIYSQLNYQKDTLRGGLNILNLALQSSEKEAKEEILKKIELVNQRLNKIDDLKQSIKNQLPGNEYLVDPYSNTMDMLKSMEINDLPQFFNAEHKVYKKGDGDKYYRIVTRNEKGEVKKVDYEKAWDEGTQQYLKNIDITVDAEGNEISRELSKGDIWRPIEFRQRYKIINNERAGVAITRPGEVVDTTKGLVVEEGVSKTSFDLNSDPKWVWEVLNREENVKNLGKSGDEFFDVQMIYDDSIPVIFRNDVTGETFEGTIKKVSAVDQVHGTEFKRVILETDGENPFKYLGEGRREIALNYNSELNKWKHSNDVGQYKYVIEDDGTIKYDYNKGDYEKEWKTNEALGIDEYEDVIEAGYKTRLSELLEVLPEARYKDMEGVGDRFYSKGRGYNELGVPVYEAEYYGNKYTIYKDGTVIDDNGIRIWGRGRNLDEGLLIKATDDFVRKNAINGKSVKDLAKEYKIPLYFLQDEYLKKLNNRALARTDIRNNGLDIYITFGKLVTEGTCPHELFHSIFLGLDDNIYERYINRAEKLFGLSEEGGHREANEMLADLFSEYFRTGTFTLPKDINIAQKTFYEQIKQWFKNISDWLKGVNEYEDELTKLFNDILDNKVSTLSKDTKENMFDKRNRIKGEYIDSELKDDGRKWSVDRSQAYMIFLNQIKKGKTFDEAVEYMKKNIPGLRESIDVISKENLDIEKGTYLGKDYNKRKKIYMGEAYDKKGFQTSENKLLINNLKTEENQAKQAMDIADTTNTYSDIENVSNAQSRVLAFTNYDKIGEDTYLKYVRGRRNVLLNNKKKELERIQSEWNKLTMTMSKEEQQKAIEDIRKTLTQWKLNNKGEYTARNPMGTNTTVKYKQIINDFANVFADEGWYNTSILGQINSVNSIDDIIVKLHTNDLISTMGINADATSVNKTRDIIYNWIRGSVKTDKEAMQIAKDFIGDPLGSGAAYKLMANTRAAYRFAKYGLLSPVSGAIMYGNSAVLGNILMQGKKKGLEGYLGSSVFDEITGLDNVLSFLNRGDDLITNSGSDIENKGIFVNKMLNSIVNTITKQGTKANQVLSTIVNGGWHSLYDLFHQGEVRKYAFAQALKQNHIYESQLPSLLELLKSGKIMDDPKTSVLWSNIMAKTEENYARFFTNASTSALSRHRWSRLWGFNFLQGYVINRTDEMMLGMRKRRDFVNQAGGFKNMTWDDITRHLAEDNTELKSFMNNIILSAKMAYYLDKAADADGTEADNIRAYFIDTNDYLSSLDTVWFMRLLKAPLEGVGAYRTYSEWAGEEANMWGGLKVGVYESFAEVCKQFFREGKFLSAIANPLIAAMQTGDLDFASTVAGVEWEKMANSLGRFGLVEGMEKYGLEDFSEDSDIIGQVLLNTDRSTRVGKETDDLYDISRVDSIINDPNYAAITTIGYLPLIGELIKSATNNGGFGFNEAKYKKLMNMVETDPDIKKLYNGELDVSLYSDEAINRLWTDFTSFNYPYKSMKSAGKHDVGSMFQGKDSTLNSMREDVFVKNICDKMNIDIETFHKLITENGSANAKTTGKLKVIAAAEAAEPGSGKIVLGYMMANALYELEKEVSGMDYPSNADFTDEQMNYMKKVILNQYGNEMFTADKASWYKAVRELVSIKEPEVFNTLYKNETLNGYVSSIGFLDMLMWDAANKGDVNAKYIKNVFSVISKYMTNPEARMKAIEHEVGVISELNTSQSVKNMAMEGVLAGNIDYYNRIKENPTLSVLYKDVLDSFEHRVWGVIDNVDIQDDSMKRQGKKWYTPYTSKYGDDNKKVEDDLKNKVGKDYNPLKSGGKSLGYNMPSSVRTTIPQSEALKWYRKYYEELIKDYSDRLVKSMGKKYPAEGTENITFKTGSNNRGSIRGAKLEFPKHKSKEYRTNVISNLPGSHG